MRREDLYNVYIEVKGTDGQTATFQCDKLTPIGTKAKSTQYRPANGLENELSLGGPRKTDPLTLTRLYDITVDSRAHWLLSQAGRAGAVVTKQPLDDNGHPFGSPQILNGKLDEFITPGTDSESDKAALCTFMVTPETNVG
jgi:hypothetical protein